MAKIKYFKTLPENQYYYYKDFESVGKQEGCLCEECGTYIQNIVTVVGSVDHIEYHLGLTCCEKQAKIDDGVKFGKDVPLKVKFWKSRLSKLRKFRKDFDNCHKDDTIAIQGKFFYNPREKQAKIDFGFLYGDGNWRWMYEDFPITKIYNKVKETFADVWDQVDWMGMDACATMETSAEVYKALKEGTVKCQDWNAWCETHYPEWDQKNAVSRAIKIGIQSANYAYGKDTPVKLPAWFQPNEYQKSIFDEVVATMAKDSIYREEDLKATEFIVYKK